MTKDDAAFWLNQIKERYIKGGDEEFDRCRKEAIDMAIEALQERKTGKWIREFKSEEDFIRGNYSYRCPFCGEYGARNYCSECGARLEVDE